MERQHINPESAPDATEHGYSHAIVAGGTFYISGQVGMDGDRNLAGDDITAQTRQAFDNVEAILAEVGRDTSDVVKVKAHIVDPHERFADYDAVYQSVFSAPYPCHTVLGVEQLAGPEYLVEIEVDVPVED
jgi:enamine deaminase RidA (YjgF/YER057c/UK114 family)